MQVKRACRHTTRLQTDGRHMKYEAAQDEDSVSSSPLLMSLQQVVVCGRRSYNSTQMSMNLKTNTKFLPFYLPQPGAARVQTAKLSLLHLFSSPDLSLLSPTFLQRPPSLPVCLPLFSTPFKSPQKLHCHVTLTSQRKWHNGYNLTKLKISTL